MARQEMNHATRNCGDRNSQIKGPGFLPRILRYGPREHRSGWGMDHATRNFCDRNSQIEGLDLYRAFSLLPASWRKSGILDRVQVAYRLLVRNRLPEKRAGPLRRGAPRPSSQAEPHWGTSGHAR
jgi:hypothetical protein